MREAPEFLTDLNLDQIVASITAGRDEYNLKPFFCSHLSHVEAVNYRQDVMQDLENKTLFGHLQLFAQEMRTMRSHLAQSGKLFYKYQKQSWFLDAVDVYCGAVGRLTSDLALTESHSRGFLAFREYLRRYTESADFALLVTETHKLRADLSAVQYSLHIEGKRIEVGRYDSKPDYGADVLNTFEKFKQGAAREYQFNFPFTPEMNHVEEAVLDMVAQMYPDLFSFLDGYCSRQSRRGPSIIQPAATWSPLCSDGS